MSSGGSGLQKVQAGLGRLLPDGQKPAPLILRQEVAGNCHIPRVIVDEQELDGGCQVMGLVSWFCIKYTI